MGKIHWPSTAATRVLQAHEVPYTPHLYRYEEHGGTRLAARDLGVPEHSVVKTLVMEDENSRPLLVLMHGDLEVSTRQLARQIGCRTVKPCRPEVASRHSGYLIGGTSPLGTRKALPVYLQRTILELPEIHVNGGSRGFLVALAPGDLVRVLQPTLVDVAIAKEE